MKIDTSNYYPWDSDRLRPAEKAARAEIETGADPEIETAGVEIETGAEVEMETAGVESEAGAEAEIETAGAGIETGDDVAASATVGVGAGEQLSEQATEKSSQGGDEPESPEAPPGLMTVLSHFLSWVLSPIIVPTLGIIAVFSLSMFSYAPTTTKFLITAIVFGITGVIPATAIFVLTKFGDVKDMALTRRSDRLFPYIITAACLLACGIYLTRTGLPAWVGYFYIGAAAATVINLFVNFKWKISAHGAGIGGLIAMFVILNRYGLPAYNLWGWVVAAVIAAGLLGTARVWLWRHTPMQTIAGEIVGFICVILTEAFLN